MTSYELVVLILYVTLVGALSFFSIHRVRLALLARRVWRLPAPPITPRSDWPTVLVQLPLYNEPLVAERIIDAACRLDYPGDRLSVQVLDDSTDETPLIVARVVRAWQERGVDVVHIRRGSRQAFKAGALAYGLERSRSELVAIFDADFVPHPDFLRRLVSEMDDPEVGMVQARWEHLNRGRSLLTRVQAVMLDGHFINEHGGRFALGCFFNFNGTAGIWRRACIDDAGGWSGVTLTEDLELSYRAQLRGWRFVYRPDVDVPAELPEDVTAFKSQQHRWAKGAIETAKLLLPSIWRAPVPFRVKLEATFHLVGNFTYPLVFALSVLMPLAALARPSGFGSWLWFALDTGLLVGATGSLVCAYALASRGAGAPRRTSLYFFAVLAVGIGLSINNIRALWEAMRGQRSPFVRTPKSGGASVSRTPKLTPAWVQVAVEGLLGAYLFFGAMLALAAGRYGAVPFLLLFAFGYSYLAVGSLPRLDMGLRLRSSVDTPSVPEENLTA